MTRLGRSPYKGLPIDSVRARFQRLRIAIKPGSHNPGYLAYIGVVLVVRMASRMRCAMNQAEL